jgi:hypothetical protein
MDEFYATVSIQLRCFTTTVLAGNLKLQPSGLGGEGRIFLKEQSCTDKFGFRAYELMIQLISFQMLYSDGFTVLTENMKSLLISQTIRDCSPPM